MLLHSWVGVNLYPSPLQACIPTQWLGLESHQKAIKSVFAESQRLSAPPLGLRRMPWSQGLGAYVTPRVRWPTYSSSRCRLPSGRSDPQLRGAVFGGPRYRPYWNASFIDGSSGNYNEAQPRCRAATPAIFRRLRTRRQGQRQMRRQRKWTSPPGANRRPSRQRRAIAAGGPRRRGHSHAASPAYCLCRESLR